VDGTGAPPQPADVVIDADRIVAVDAPGAVSQNGDVVDLDGLVLAPGFIDCHTHYDAQVLWDPDLTPSSWHGVTTVVMGNCLGEEAAERDATSAEIEAMRRLVAGALDAGAIGFASSRQPAHAGAWGKPVPSRLATTDELMRLAEPLAERDRGTFAITHGPDFGPAELAELSVKTGRPVTWTALNASPGAFRLLDKAAARGGEVWPQVACRPIVFQVTLAEPAPARGQKVKTRRAGTWPVSTSSMQALTSSRCRSCAMTFVRPAACSANTSARSLRVPTMDPMIDFPLMTVSKIGTVILSSAGSATHTSRPPRRSDPNACSNARGDVAREIATSAPPRSRMAATGSVVRAFTT